MNKAVFLDRDGVLNIEKGHYIYELSDFEINLGAVNFLKEAINKNYKLIVITNQGGIAKGLYSKDTVTEIHKKMKQDFLKHGIIFDDIFYCPHHDEYGKCLCRKPSPLMIQRALHRYNIDKNHAFIIGDKERDVKSGESAGIKGFLIEANQNLDFLIKEL